MRWVSENDAGVEKLRGAVETEYGRVAEHYALLPVVRMNRAATLWNGIVIAFHLTDESTGSPICYAWHCCQRRNAAIILKLKLPPISCAEDAVAAWLKERSGGWTKRPGAIPPVVQR